jgi:secreted PhoX family phosphatase
MALVSDFADNPEALLNRKVWSANPKHPNHQGTIYRLGETRGMADAWIKWDDQTIAPHPSLVFVHQANSLRLVDET